jgi:hypothetical protein
MVPQIAQFLLPANVPHYEVDGFVVELLNIEADGWDGHEDLAQLQRVQYCGLTSSIEPQHHDFATFFGKFLGEEAFYYVPHLNIYNKYDIANKAGHSDHIYME